MSSDRKGSRRRALIAAGAFIATGVALAAAFFPYMFNRWLPRDDEGVFIFALRESIAKHGHLYSTIWSDLYGPFYYGFMSTVYRVIHQQPTATNGRWIVLVLTTASAVFFGAAVWRVAKNLPVALACEVAAFMLLIPIAGSEPMHPGSLGVFLVSLVAFELSAYAATKKTAHLVGIGLFTGALVMTKVNAGGLVAVAVVFVFIVGNLRTRRWMQIVVAVLAGLFPIALISQHKFDSWADTFAILVIATIAAMFVLMSIDQLSLPRFPLIPVAAGAVVAVLVSLAYPLVTGSPLSDVISGVFIRPLTFSDAFTVPATVTLDWFSFVIAMAGLCFAVAFRSFTKDQVRAQAKWMNGALAALALYVLGVGVTSYVAGYITARWLPLIIVLPALAFCSESPEPVRWALRATVVLATLQVLVAYPVAGSQVAWATVAMVVPCGIALAAGVGFGHIWRDSTLVMRIGAGIFLCLALVVASNTWPTSIWKSYADSTPFGLPGTSLMRIDPTVASNVQQTVTQLRAHCDTFYGVPDLNSFYIFTGLPPVTDMLANGSPGGLTASQQRQVIDDLQSAQKSGKRVCILRDSTQPVVLPQGPLYNALNQYLKVVASAGSYTVATPN